MFKLNFPVCLRTALLPQANARYTFQLLVCALGRAGLCSAASSSVTVASAGLFAVVSGGGRLVGAGSAFTLSGSGSSDLDRLGAPSYAIVFVF